MKYIALLRGINVGGNRKILMVNLKNMFESLHFKNIITYIQSGNVIFESNQPENQIDLQNRLEESIKNEFSFDVPVIIRSVEEWNSIILNTPFQLSDTDRLHITFLENSPSPTDVKELQAFTHPTDQWVIKENNAYVFCAKKYSDTKFTNEFFSKKLKTRTTTRNWKTILKLQELSK